MSLPLSGEGLRTALTGHAAHGVVADRDALRALIFDVDGTLADTEQVHLEAFNRAFAAMGMGWRWDEARYLQLLEVAGGKERILHDWRQREPSLIEAEAAPVVAQLHRRKTEAYAELAAEGALRLRPGIESLIEAARREGLPIAIATTTTPANIDALLAPVLGADWRRCFAAVGDAQSAPRKKPDPQVYHQCLAAMALPGSACLALEDSANGLSAARAAGIPTVISTNTFTRHQVFPGALRVLPDLGGIDLAQLRLWHRETLT